MYRKKFIDNETSYQRIFIIKKRSAISVQKLFEENKGKFYKPFIDRFQKNVTLCTCKELITEEGYLKI